MVNKEPRVFHFSRILNKRLPLVWVCVCVLLSWKGSDSLTFRSLFAVALIYCLAFCRTRRGRESVATAAKTFRRTKRSVNASLCSSSHGGLIQRSAAECVGSGLESVGFWRNDHACYRMRQRPRQSRAKAKVRLHSCSSQPIRRSGVGISEAACGHDLRLWMQSWIKQTKKQTKTGLLPLHCHIVELFNTAVRRKRFNI